MEREIKFRGKAKDGGTWVHGDLTTSNTIHTSPSWHEDGEGEWWGHECHEETIGQFTGLKDKNRVEIYEGDIVIEESYPMYDRGLCNYRCVVVWYEEEAGFGLEMYVVSNRVRGCAVPDSISEYTELEVIGNIYDNPDLLKDKQ